MYYIISLPLPSIGTGGGEKVAGIPTGKPIPGARPDIKSVRRRDKNRVPPDLKENEYAISYCKYAPRCPYATDRCKKKDARNYREFRANGRSLVMIR